MDPVGIAFVMGGIINSILAVEYDGQKRPWHRIVVIGLLVGAVLIWISFGVWEVFQGERTMLMPRLICPRYVWQPAIFQFFFAGSYFILLYYLPNIFQSVHNTSSVRSGVRNLLLVLAITIGSAFSGVVVSKTGRVASFMLGGAVLSTIGAGLM